MFQEISDWGDVLVGKCRVKEVSDGEVVVR